MAMTRERPVNLDIDASPRRFRVVFHNRGLDASQSETALSIATMPQSDSAVNYKFSLELAAAMP